MTILDADILVMDLGYIGDPNYPANRRFLDYLSLSGIERGITTQGLLEVVGKRSYQTPATLILSLPSLLAGKYGLKVIPDPTTTADYATCTVDEIVAQMTRQMSLGDAIMAVQLAKFAPGATALVTWNAKHFRGKLTAPVFTPEEWLQQQPPAAQTTPTGPTP